MVAVIASHRLWWLNFVHVFCGLLWTGIDLFMGFVLGPSLMSRWIFVDVGLIALLLWPLWAARR